MSDYLFWFRINTFWIIFYSISLLLLIILFNKLSYDLMQFMSEKLGLYFILYRCVTSIVIEIFNLWKKRICIYCIIFKKNIRVEYYTICNSSNPLLTDTVLSGLFILGFPLQFYLFGRGFHTLVSNILFPSVIEVGSHTLKN